MRNTTAITGLLISLLAGACFAEAVPLPVEQLFEARRLELDLRDSQVELIFAADQDPAITITDLVHGDDTSGFVLLEEKTDALRIGQPHGDGEIAPSLLVEITVPPGQKVLIEGRQLTILIRDLRGELLASERELIVESAGLERAKAASPGGMADNLKVDVEDSDVTLSGVVGGKLSGTRTRYHLESCRGPFLFDSENAINEIRGHWGNLYLGGEDNEYQIEGGDQAIEYRLVRGSLRVIVGMGNFRGTSTETTIFLDQWDGDLNTEGERNNLEILHSGHQESLTKLSGADNDIRLEDLRGSLSMDLVAGHVTGELFEGTVAIRGDDGARFEMKDFGDSLQVQLTENAFAQVKGVAKGVKVEIQDAEFEAEDIAGINGKVSGSTVRVSELAGRLRLVATESELDLDLSESTSTKISLELKGESRARVALREPCMVRTKGSQQAGRDVSVTGCEVIERGARRPPVRRVAGQPAPVTLEVEMDEGAELEAWGR